MRLKKVHAYIHTYYIFKLSKVEEITNAFNTQIFLYKDMN